MRKESSTSNGIGFLSLLGLLFVGLKLGHVINWSWWWVTCPFWGVFAIAAAAFAVIAAVIGLTMFFAMASGFIRGRFIGK